MDQSALDKLPKGWGSIPSDLNSTHHLMLSSLTNESFSTSLPIRLD